MLDYYCCTYVYMAMTHGRYSFTLKVLFFFVSYSIYEFQQHCYNVCT